MLRSSDRNILDNREDPRVRLGWQRDYDKGRYGLVGTYVESSTLSSAVLETGVVTTDGTQKLYTLTGNWSRQLSERGLLENETSYDDASYDVSTLIGYKEYANRLSYTYAGPSAPTCSPGSSTGVTNRMIAMRRSPRTATRL